MTNTTNVLTSLEELPVNSKLALYGAGETGQEFVRKLQMDRPDIDIVCFFDSYRDGSWENIPILKSSKIENLDANVELIITSVFWNEIAEIIELNFPRNYKILSNNIINQCSHLSSYGSFYFEDSDYRELEKRLSNLNDSFQSDQDREVIRKLFDLRVYKKEKEFFSFADKFTRNEKNSFHTKDKYSKYLELDKIRYLSLSVLIFFIAKNTEAETNIIIHTSGIKAEELREEIKAAFSDEVAIEFDEEGKSGTVKPILPEVENQKYLFKIISLE